jgi:hypothetical protein
MLPLSIEMGQVHKESPSHIRATKNGLRKDMSPLDAVKAILEDERAFGEEYSTLLHSKVRPTVPASSHEMVGYHGQNFCVTCCVVQSIFPGCTPPKISMPPCHVFPTALQSI